MLKTEGLEEIIMSDSEKIVAKLEIGKADLRLKDLDMSMDQDLPWRDTFQLKDLKLLFSREIEEDGDSYVKEDLSFGDREVSVGEMTIGEVMADLEDIRIHLEDSSGSVDLESERQKINLKNLESNDLSFFLDEALVGKSVTSKLIGCDFGINMFPPSAGLSCVDEAFLRLSDVVFAFIFEKEAAEEEMDEVGGNLFLESIDVVSEDSSLLDLDLEGDNLERGKIGKEWDEIFTEGKGFDFDLNKMILDFGSLEINRDEAGPADLSFEDYSRGFRDLIGNLKGLVDQGLEFVDEKK